MQAEVSSSAGSRALRLLQGAGPEQGEASQGEQRDEAGEGAAHGARGHEPQEAPREHRALPGAGQQARHDQGGAAQGAAVQDPQEPAVGAQGERVGKAQEEMQPQGGSQAGAEPAEAEAEQQERGGQAVHPQRKAQAHQQARQSHVVEMPGAFPGWGGDHHQQPRGPGHQPGQQHDERRDVERLDQFHRKTQDPPVPLDGVDQDPPFRLIIDEAYGLVQGRGRHLPVLDHDQFITFQQPGILRRAVGQDLLDEHLPALDLPGALVVRRGVDPLVQVERPQSQDQGDEAGQDQSPTDGSEGGRQE